jgi:hypothetical protein
MSGFLDVILSKSGLLRLGLNVHSLADFSYSQSTELLACRSLDIFRVASSYSDS